MITEFKGKYAFLSNFHPSPIVYQGTSYATVEHAFQAAKTNDPWWKDKISTLDYPGQAKKWGKRCPMRPDWKDIRLDVMKELLILKFKDVSLMRDLMATHPHILEEGNQWGDTFWGVCNGLGWNHLGLLLMEIRDRAIQKEDAFEKALDSYQPYDVCDF